MPEFDAQQLAAEAWFRSLRDRITAEFERIEDEGAALPALPNAPQAPGRFTFTTTEAFVEGAGHSYGAGTNVVCVDAGSGSYKWDVLAGIIDLTELTADEVQTLWDSI